jgi:hypothetical protein
MQMLTKEQTQLIQTPFPPEALSADTSRGFELTSIKAAFVIERLNEVFGHCGIGWRYVHSPFDEVQTHDGRIEILTEVAFQYRYGATNDYVGCARVIWDAQVHDWALRNSNNDWSEPIFAAGGKSVGKGGAVFTDARKSAVTDGLTKAASMLGIGADVFKGLVRVGTGNGHTRTSDNGRQLKHDATAFWTLYNAQGKAAGIAMEVAKGLADNGNWQAAIKELSALINGAKS